jgi:hypothetical protein
LHKSKSVKHCTNVHVVPSLPVDELLDDVLHSTVPMLHSGPLQVLQDIHQHAMKRDSEVCTSALCGLLLFIVSVAALTDSTTSLAGVIDMKIECVGSGRECFGWATFPITDDSFLLVNICEIGRITLIHWH